MKRGYKGTPLIRNTPLPGAYSRTIPRVLWWSKRGKLFLMSEEPLYGYVAGAYPGPIAYSKTARSVSSEETDPFDGSTRPV